MTTITTSAPGADELSSRIDVSTSPANASLTVRKPAEPENVPATCKAQAGGHRVTRRTLMNIAVNSVALVAAPIAIPTPAVSEEANLAIDYSAMLKRAEYVIECLRTRYICDSWSVDEEGAERALRYFRSQAAGEPDNEEEWGHVIDFFSSHGQFLHWILNGDPSGLICGVASQSNRARAGGSALAPEADPIFALIQKHKKANTEFYDALEIVPGTHSPDPEKERLYSDREYEARYELASTTPTTLEGLLAVLSYVNDGLYDGRAKPSGKPDESFEDDQLINLLVGVQECVQTSLQARS
jgi:hypothetical protein